MVRPSRRLPWQLAVADLAGAALVAVVLLPPMPALVLTLLWWSLLALAGCYLPRVFPVGLVGLRTVCNVALVMVAIAEFAGSAVWHGRRAFLLAFVVAALCWSVGCRLVAWTYWHARRLHGTWPARAVVVVGSRPGIGRWMAEMAGGASDDLIVVAACVLGRRHLDLDVPTVYGAERLQEIVDEYHADAVLVVPCPQFPPAEVRRLAWRLEASETELLIAPGIPDVLPRRATVGVAGSVPLLHVRKAELTGTRRVIKDLWERTAALTALILMSPLLLTLIVLIRLDSSGSAIYQQGRVGRGGRSFTMFKLRTMVTGADAHVAELVNANEADGVLFKVRADPRVTRVGRVLRRYSLDELPQLWNVVRGDMALVGPRPALPEEVARYGADMHRRMVVKPGLTGLWQVSGRSDLPWNRAVQLDLYYVDNWSLGLDIAIVLRTVQAVLGHNGAY